MYLRTGAGVDRRKPQGEFHVHPRSVRLSGRHQECDVATVLGARCRSLHESGHREDAGCCQ